ncbi:Acetolactate synthase, catabolic [Raoultella planticola]|uniref:Acetolactate synthase, catabolic n=1 Tax=Raoultella planticola TaxID=575 RepID=A0A485AJZ6_RAOPL|nr:Acetolactate synthase, catabolic [Raoultella planticola]
MDNQRHERQWAHGADMIVSQLEAQGGTPGLRHPRRENR